MSDIKGFHAHIYYDVDQLDDAKALADRARERFYVTVGRFHEAPVGPHPRGSCQLGVPTDDFGAFAIWAALNRGGLTIFAHADTGEDLIDHSQYVVWFGESETLNLSIFE